MSRYELGMSMDYVSHWTVVDAVREIFQNSLDEEIQNPENKWYFNYDNETETLRVGNKLSVLDTSSLLLGKSSKRDDNKTIGQYGEGYKVATVVLLRNGCGLTVYNYNEKCVWKARVIKSRRYNENICVFDVEKMLFFEKVPENSLIFEITGISEEMISNIKERNLWLQEDLGEVIETESGKILKDSKYKGKLFVKGLYVCDNNSLNYGYDLEPSLVKLDRDRGLIESFDLYSSLAKVIMATNDISFITSMMNTSDGSYLRYHLYNSGIDVGKILCDTVHDNFRDKYGSDAIPVTSMETFNNYKQTYGINAVMVSENEYYYIKNSSKYKEAELTIGSKVDLKALQDW